MNDSYKIGHSRCPKCAEMGRDRHGDNLVEYSDGHTYCFACGFRTRNTLKSLLNANSLSAYPETKRKDSISQVHTFSSDIPKKYRSWLSKNQIRPELIDKYGIKYNETTDGLCFELAGGGRVERNIEDPETSNAHKRVARPKWITRRKRLGVAASNCWGTPERGGFCVLVEDAVSAIRVASIRWPLEKAGRPVSSYPLLGTNINGTDLYSLCRAFYGIGVWLDRDKRDKALQIAARASQWNSNTTVISSERDPKSYSDDALRNFLEPLVSK